MIKKLDIKNFQSHRDSSLEFSEDVTAIVGLNNHGKSVIFRALQKGIRNIPDGHSFITDGKIECNVTIGSDEGTVIRKVKNDKSTNANMYIVNDEEYVKFGKNVPIEVLSCFPTSPPQTFGDIEIDLNFANQLDPLFLMVGMGLPALRGKVLSKASGVDKVQRAITIGSSEGKKLKNSLNTFIEQQNELNTKLLSYKDLDQQLLDSNGCENQLIIINQDRVKLEGIHKGKENIKGIVQNAKNLQAIIDKLNLAKIEEEFELFSTCQNTYNKALSVQSLCVQHAKAHEITAQIEESLPTIDEIQTFLQNSTGTLNKLINFHQIEVQLNSINNVLPTLEEKLPTVANSLEDLQQSKERYDKLSTAVNKLHDINIILTPIDSEILDLEKQEVEIKVEFEEYKKEIKVCPTCNRPWE